jgi:hypothetical protein
MPRRYQTAENGSKDRHHQCATQKRYGYRISNADESTPIHNG